MAVGMGGDCEGGTREKWEHGDGPMDYQFLDVELDKLLWGGVG